MTPSFLDPAYTLDWPALAEDNFDDLPNLGVRGEGVILMAGVTSTGRARALQPLLECCL